VVSHRSDRSAAKLIPDPWASHPGRHSSSCACLSADACGRLFAGVHERWPRLVLLRLDRLFQMLGQRSRSAESTLAGNCRTPLRSGKENLLRQTTRRFATTVDISWQTAHVRDGCWADRSSLDCGRAPPISQLSGWAALTDGSILEAIQTGWHLYANDGRAPCYASAAGVEAARGWEEFFRQLRENPGISEDRLIEIRLTAEQRGATYGYTLAHQRFHSSGFFLRCKITVFAYAADMYRSIALIARSYGLQHVDFTGVTDPRTSWPSLSLAGKLTTPAALAFSIGAAFLSLSGLTTSVTS